MEIKSGVRMRGRRGLQSGMRKFWGGAIICSLSWLCCEFRRCISMPNLLNLLQMRTCSFGSKLAFFPLSSIWYFPFNIRFLACPELVRKKRERERENKAKGFTEQVWKCLCAIVVCGHMTQGGPLSIFIRHGSCISLPNLQRQETNSLLFKRYCTRWIWE